MRFLLASSIPIQVHSVRKDFLQHGYQHNAILKRLAPCVVEDGRMPFCLDAPERFEQFCGKIPRPFRPSGGIATFAFGKWTTNHALFSC